MTTSGQKRRNVHYFIILTYYFNAYEKEYPGMGYRVKTIQPMGGVLSWSLSMYSLLEKSLRKGLFKGSGCSKTCNIFVFKFCSSYSISLCVHRLNLFTSFVSSNDSFTSPFIFYHNDVNLAVKMYLEIKLII